MRSRIRNVHLKRLSLSRFLSLPKSVIARVCRFLNPLDLLSLAHTSKRLRLFLMSKASKPCWDDALDLYGTPCWHGIAAPEAVAFLFGTGCQGMGCEEEARIEALHVCRQYCWNCAAKNLMDSEEVLRDFPDLSPDVLQRLPWTKQRPSSHNERIQDGQYYLKRDVVRLWQRVQACSSQSDLERLESQLTFEQRERRKATAAVQIWHTKANRSRRQVASTRWAKICSVMQKRWRWHPVPYEKLSPSLKPIVDYLINVPSLTEKVWNSIRGELNTVFEAETRSRDRGQRPFSLHLAAESKSSLRLHHGENRSDM